MKNVKYLFLTGFLLISTTLVMADGGGDFRLGYTYLDQDGNQSIDQSSFNYYDGVGVSFENFRYRFDNGIKVSSDLSNVNLGNRNLTFGITKPGLFGADVRSSQFKRVYDFDGSDYTKRNLTYTSVWVNPQKYVKLFAKGFFNDLSGTSNDLFGSDFIVIPNHVDYNSNKFTVGTTINYQSRMIHAEYATTQFDDDVNSARDQTRQNLIFRALTPVPRFEWIILTGVYHRFETQYDQTDFRILSNTAKGSAYIDLPHDFALNYYFIFNRAGSDSDIVETDNVAHAVYGTWKYARKLGITVGYQNDIRDDYENAVRGNSLYSDVWYDPTDNVEFRGEYGYRNEDVDEGSRLIGDESRNKFKLYGKYKANGMGSIKIGMAAKVRKNNELGSKVNYNHFYGEGTVTSAKYATLSAGYSYSTGKYENVTQTFEFNSHQLHGDIRSREYKNSVGEFGVLYYRTGQDLDVESYQLRFKLIYMFPGGNRLEAAYNVFNFDDLMLLDSYYTENMVEINIIKTFKF